MFCILINQHMCDKQIARKLQY